MLLTFLSILLQIERKSSSCAAEQSWCVSEARVDGGVVVEGGGDVLFAYEAGCEFRCLG